MFQYTIHIFPSNHIGNFIWVKVILERLKPLYPSIIPFTNTESIYTFIPNNFSREKSKVGSADNNFRMLIHSFNSPSRLKIILVRTCNATESDNIWPKFL